MTKEDAVSGAQAIARHAFSTPQLLVTALTHSSVANTRLESNERLEFLGDSVLGTVVCDELYRRYADWLEGDLTKVKSFVVSRRVCAGVADEIGLTDMLILGNGIDTRSALPTSLRAAVYEALIGAIFVDGGFLAAKEFILRTIGHHIDWCAGVENHENHKSALQQYAQRWLSAIPHYDPLDEQGPDHSKCFEVCVTISGKRFPSAWGSSKKEAEQEAARRALQELTATSTDTTADERPSAGERTDDSAEGPAQAGECGGANRP